MKKLKAFVYHKHMKLTSFVFALCLFGCDGIYINRFKIATPEQTERKDDHVLIANKTWFIGDQWITSTKVKEPETKFIGLQSIDRDIVTVTVSEVNIDGADLKHDKSKLLAGNHFNCSLGDVVSCVSTGTTPSLVVQCFGQLDSQGALMNACVDIIETSLEP